MKKLKISFVIPRPTRSGGDLVIATHAKLLKEKGHRVTITGPGRQRPPIIEMLRALKQGRIAKDKLSDTNHYKEAGVEVDTLDYRTKITAKDLPDADIVIATLWRTAEWVHALPPEKGKKVYFIQGHEIFPYFPVNRVKATYRLPLYQITIANWLGKIMQGDYGRKAPAIVPNSANFEIFNSPPREKSNRPRVGFLYAHSSVKGVDVTTKAIALIQENMPDIEVVSFGAVEPSQDLPLPKGCEYHQKPSQNKIRDIYSSCDVWITGSRLEGFGLTILEAAACRCPNVSTRAGGPDDLINNGETGYLVDLEDAEALAARTMEILSMNQDDWRRMSTRAYEKARAYTWTDAGQNFEAALFDALGSSE